jgi:8-oxo-dGTP pyrophosphatase MutT (NUDIX family)
VAEAAARELLEETGVNVAPSALEGRGILDFAFEGKPEWNQQVHVFVTKGYAGPDPVETEEMRPKWFDVADIPYDSMWSDDPYWLPRVIEGESVEFSFVFDEDGDLAEVNEVYSGS